MSSVNDLRRQRLHALLVELVESLEVETALTIPILLPGSDTVSVLVSSKKSKFKGTIMLQDDTTALGLMMTAQRQGRELEQVSSLGSMLFGGTDSSTGLRGPAARIARAGTGPRRGFYPFLMKRVDAGPQLPTPADERRYLVALECFKKARAQIDLANSGADMNLQAVPGLVVTGARGEAGDQGIDFRLQNFDLSYLVPDADIIPLSEEETRWHEANARASHLISEAGQKGSVGSVESMFHYFGEGSHDEWIAFMEIPGAATAYVEWFARCHRPQAEDLTLLESLIKTEKARYDSDVRTILWARMNSKVSLYRSRKLEGRLVEFEDVFSAASERIDLGILSLEFTEDLVRTLTIVDFGPLRFPLDAGPVFSEKELPEALARLAGVSGVEAEQALGHMPHAAGRLYRLRSELDAAP